MNLSFRWSFPLLALLGSGLLLLGAQWWGRSSPALASPAAFEAGEKPETGPGHPGWVEQWKTMKGEVPRDIVQRIRQQQPFTKSGNTHLINVQALGPDNFGGRTRALIFDNADPLHLIAGGISGGIWHSYNQGQSWSLVDDQAPTLSVTSLSQDPFNPDVIYYSTGEAAGNSAGIPGDGIYKSTDGGLTFSPLPSSQQAAFESTWFVQASRTTPGIVYVGTDSYGLYISLDGGNTFVSLFTDGTNELNDMAQLPNGDILISIGYTGIYKATAQDPFTFNKVTLGLPANPKGRIALAHSESQPNVIYAAIENDTGERFGELQGVWKSLDGGDSWTEMANPNDVPGSNFYFPWYALMLEVKPDDPNFVLIGCVNLFYSQNGGSGWQEAPNSHPDYHLTAFDPNDPDRMFVANDNGIHFYDARFIQNGAIDLNMGYNVTQFYAGNFFPTGLSIIGGTQDNGTHRSLNGATVSTQVFGGDGGYAHVHQQQPNISYVSWQQGRILRTSNSQSGNPSYSYALNLDDSTDYSAWFINPYEINPLNGDQLFSVTREGLLRSNDRGDSWTPLISGLPANLSPYAIGITEKMNPTVYVGGNASTFFRVDSAGTANLGQAVNLRLSVPTSVNTGFISCITPHPDEEGTLYVSYSNYSPQPRVWKVRNAHTAQPLWQAVSGDLPSELPVNWIEVSRSEPDDYLIAGTDFGLYTSRDGGQTWSRETDLPNVPVFQARLRPSDERLFVFTHGRGVWTAELFGIPASQEVSQPAVPQLSLGPNPSSDWLRVWWEADAPREARYRLLDMQGRTLRQGVWQGQERQIDLSGLPAGHLLLRVETEGGQVTRRLVKGL